MWQQGNQWWFKLLQPLRFGQYDFFFKYTYVYKREERKGKPEVLLLSASDAVNISSSSPSMCHLFSFSCSTCEVQSGREDKGETQKFFWVTGLIRRRGHTTRTAVKPINPPHLPALTSPWNDPWPFAGTTHLPGAHFQEKRPSL